MQVTELETEGLKRSFKVVIAAQDIQSKVDGRLSEIGKTIRLPGFRPGKVPMPLLKKKFGPSVMGEVLERAVMDASSQAMSERGLRPAIQPKVDITAFAEGSDLEYTLAVELLPDITPMSFSDMELERLKAEPTDEQVDKALQRLADQQEKSEKVTEDRPAQKGDIIVFDFDGTVDGTAQAGMKAEGSRLKLGSGQFIPGFEDQIAGRKAGERFDVKVTFPADYANDKLAGKEAVFAVNLKEIHQPLPVAVDEALAKSVGLDDLDSLKKFVRDQMVRDFARISRDRLKRQVLDKLAEAHNFPVPQGMVDLEFDAIWKSIEAERKRGADDPTIKGKSDDELKEEFRKIAERRVRLGLLLSEVGRMNNIQVTPEEVNRAVLEEARRFPGQERKVVEYYKNNPEAVAQVRAPLFEDKVIDFIVELAKVGEKPVTPDELMREPEETSAAAAAPAQS